MNYILLTNFIVFCLSSCNPDVKTSRTLDNLNFRASGDTVKENEDTIISIRDIKLDSIEPLDKSKEKQPAYINSRIKQLTDHIVTKWCKDAGFDSIPDYILFRVFKHERQFEIWGRRGNEGLLKRIKTIDVCAIEDTPGPKLKGWDFNTAGGFYTYNIS